MPILIGPTKTDTVVLDDFQYEVLKGALNLMKREPYGLAVAHALRHERDVNTDGDSLDGFFFNLIAHAGDHYDEITGLLYVSGGETDFICDEDERGEMASSLAAYLRVLCRADWLAKFLLARMNGYAEKCPQPTEVLWQLSDAAEEFAGRLEVAQELLEQHPDVLNQDAATTESETCEVGGN